MKNLSHEQLHTYVHSQIAADGATLVIFSTLHASYRPSRVHPRSPCCTVCVQRWAAGHGSIPCSCPLSRISQTAALAIRRTTTPVRLYLETVRSSSSSCKSGVPSSTWRAQSVRGAPTLLSTLEERRRASTARSAILSCSVLASRFAGMLTSRAMRRNA